MFSSLGRLRPQLSDSTTHYLPLVRSDWAVSVPATTVLAHGQDAPSSAPPASSLRGPLPVVSLALAVALVAILCCALLAPAARADSVGAPAGSAAPALLSAEPCGIQPSSYSATVSTLQAGGHPDVTVSLAFDSHPAPEPFPSGIPNCDVRTVAVQNPPGLSGDPQAYPKCSAAFLAAHTYCPADTQIGMATYSLIGNGLFNDLTVPVYNMVPSADHPADFAFKHNVFGAVQIHLISSVRTGGDYGITVTAPQISTLLKPLKTKVTLWGVPGDPSHDAQRGSVLGGGCLGGRLTAPTGRLCPSNVEPKAFLSNPTQCSSPLTTTISMDSWQNPGDFTEPLISEVQRYSGCERLTFQPSLSLQPQSHQAGAPSAYEVDLHLPQSDLPTALATPDLKNSVVTLPQGVRVNPAAADGLQACTDAQIGIDNANEASCPEPSKIGTVKISTPLLEGPLEGAVYQGSQTPAHLLRLFIVVKGSGVLVKLAGFADLNPSTGQISTTFENNPQLPFEDLILSFKGGPRAPLVNPPTCGTYTTTSDLTPWSTPFTPDATPSDSFQINEGCAAHSFSPSFTAGTTSNQAGAFSPFTATIARTDADQELSAIQVTTPPGLLGVLKSVPLCDEVDANAGTCSPASRIGHTTVSSGAGSSPVFLPISGQPQNPVFLTQGYKGAPFGLSVVVPAIAGPFNLGTVVERAAIRVDSHTSQITITSDPVPRVLQGVPLQVKSINVTVDRPGFMFNPTSCAPLAVNATLSSYEGAMAAVSSPFRANDCAGLAFKPSFTTSTAGRTSKAGGASLRVHLATHEGPSGASAPGESNIARVDVQLPVVLPARLPTLQKACTADQFAKDPAGCPEGSFVGSAVAHIPILTSALSGPAILVSHGGEAFPDLVMVLQGEGIRIDLTGHTQIKKGITFSHFETVPDAPVSSFDLTLPAGPHGVLTTDVPGRNLCATTRTVTVTKHVTRRVNGHTRRVSVNAKKAVAASLLMPTTLTAQNGAVIHQSTKIAVTGCPKAKAARHARSAATKTGRR